LNGNGENKMTIQDYLIVEQNVVTNSVLWDGNTETWTPPTESIALVQATTTALIWRPNFETDPTSWKLEPVNGAGQIGFTWDGSVLTTFEPEPLVQLPPQPVTEGTLPA
jgi:hypothetical protein